MLFSKTVFAASNQAKKELPTRITSDVIDIKRKSETMEFIGHVVVKKGTDNMMSERMILFYDEENGPDNKPEDVQNTASNTVSNQAKKSSIRRIEAEENVKIFNADLVATGDSGYYDPRADIFVLENNVVVNNGSSIGKGDKFVYNLKTQKGNFVGKEKQEAAEAGQKGKDNRVTFVISNEDLKNNKKGQKDKAKNKNKIEENTKESDKESSNKTEKTEDETKKTIVNPNE